MATLLTLPAECKMLIIFAMRERSAADRKTFHGLLILCKEISQLVLANIDQIIACYTYSKKRDQCILQLFCGVLHSINDQPAIRSEHDNRQTWYHYDNIHREGSEISDLPAYISNTELRWYKNGELHREGDKPAIMRLDILWEWWWPGKPGQDETSLLDLPTMDYSDSPIKYKKRRAWLRETLSEDATRHIMTKQEWRVNGSSHREELLDKPAIIHSDGTQEWCINGQHHRGNASDIATEMELCKNHAFQSTRLFKELRSMRGYNCDVLKSRLGKLYDKPAVIRYNGKREWWIAGRYLIGDR